ncbi:DUF2971 domain-containing protein [Tunturiibacter lichenicola]|uniref:DUF2971 domain-containing protein n=1 Tax=Tunturiibacter lichenicola TaxID=2051959 RepID=UPI0021B161CF|nr:DUF2971 domain-containing protein [Edaphobacter lichenicola]
MPEVQMPAVVYHYTSMDTMMKIVESRSLWCTAISYLNDSSEREFVTSLVKGRLPTLLQEDTTIPNELDLNVKPTEDPKNITEFAVEQFVTSFSTLSDSLTHWRSYCPQQSGVAIGFRTECLQSARIDEDPQAGMVVPQVEFGRVRYMKPGDNIQLDNLIRSAAERAKNAIAKNPGSSIYLNDYFRWAIEATAVGSKHASFEAESEYRLVLFDTRFREYNIKFRTVRSSLIPYVSMRIPNREIQSVPSAWDAISSVVIGPTANMDLTEKSVKAFYKLNQMEVTIKRSEVPYRDW